MQMLTDYPEKLRFFGLTQFVCLWEIPDHGVIVVTFVDGKSVPWVYQSHVNEHDQLFCLSPSWLYGDLVDFFDRLR